MAQTDPIGQQTSMKMNTDRITEEDERSVTQSCTRIKTHTSSKSSLLWANVGICFKEGPTVVKYVL